MLRFHESTRLLPFHDGELAPSDAAEVARHLSRCARCRAELETLRFAASAVREIRANSAPAVLWPLIEKDLEGAASRAPLSRGPRTWLAPAAALALTILLAAALFYIRPPDRGWTVEHIDGHVTSNRRIATGDWVVTGPGSRARLEVARIGEVDVEPNSRVRLMRARPADHRLSLVQGSISARIWAPPRLFFVETPSALATDLGCAYNLSVDARGNTFLRVTSGWVLLENRARESMVPAGAICRTRKGAGPGVPVFEDAPAALQDALAAFDAGNDTLAAVLAHARARDTLTLFHLLPRVDLAGRVRVYDRLSALAPQAAPARDGILALDAATLRHYLDKLSWAW